MRRADLVLGLVTAAVGGWALSEALDLTMFGKNRVPGPGLFPAIVSGALLGLGVLLAGVSVRGKARTLEPVAAASAEAERPVAVGPVAGGAMVEVAEVSETRRQLRAGTVFLCYVASMPLLTVLGFVPAMAILVFALLFGIEQRRNWGALAAAILIPVACHVIFVQLLTIQLPNGPFGHGPLGI